jgi:hypothetical protein
LGVKEDPLEIEANRRSVKQLFTGGDQLEIPPYQRPYSWSLTEVDQLWVDVTDSGSEGYFLGPLVIYGDKENQTRDLVDGQQRLTTLQLLLALIRDKYQEVESPLAANPNSLIFTAGYAVGDDRFRLKSGRANWGVLRDFVLEAPNSPNRRDLTNAKDRKIYPRRVWTRNKPMLAAYARLKQQLDVYVGSNGGIAALQALDEQLAIRVDFVAIEVTGLSDAFLLFETLNDRGLRLSAADLLKSHLLRGFDQKFKDDIKLEAASASWDELVDELGGGDMTRFLRHYLLAHHRKVRKTEIFPLFQKEATQLGPDAMLEELRQAGQAYAQLLRPSQADEHLRSLLADVHDTGVITQHVALLPALRFLSEKDFVRFARISEVLAFRWSVCGLNAQELESIYQEAGQLLSEPSGPDLEAAITAITNRIPDDEQFAGSFRVQRMGTGYVARYALRKIEEATRARSELKIKAPEEVHIEHIMPVTPTDFWLEMTPKEGDYQDIVSRWGNLTLLHKAPNQEIQNGPWSKKRRHYEDSDLLVTNSLARLEAWTAKEIEFRQSWMALAATHIWTLDSKAHKALPTYWECRADPDTFNLARFLVAEIEEIADDLPA